MNGRVPFMAGLTRELPGAEKEAGAGIGKVAPERRTEAETHEAATGPPVTAGRYDSTGRGFSPRGKSEQKW